MTSVRRAVAADIPALVALDSFAVDHPERAAEIATWVEQGACIVAEAAGRALGYAVLTHDFFHRPFVEMLMVAGAARRAGIGKTLLIACAEAAGDELWSSTNASNAPMRSLLARCGFIESGRIDNLDPGDPEIVYLIRRRRS